MNVPRINLIIALCATLTALAPGWTWGHTFPERAEPRVGEEVLVAPTRVRVWFSASIEPAFSTLRVHNTNGQTVSRGTARVPASDPTLLEVGLVQLPPGTYRVFWSVAARDGHRTQGDYTFNLR